MSMKRAFSLVCLSVLAAPLAFAQPPGAPGMHHDPVDGMARRGPHGDGGGGGMGIVPPGTWWTNPQTITALNLSQDQQKRLGDIFLNSRIQLIHMHASLEEEQLKLEPLLNGPNLDQGKALGQIGQIADLRAELEKANAKMLLSLRGVLTADQWTKLQAMGPMGGDRGKDAHDGKDGPNGGSDHRSTKSRRGPGGPASGGPGGPGGNLGNPPVPPPQAE